MDAGTNWGPRAYIRIHYEESRRDWGGAKIAEADEMQDRLIQKILAA